MLNCCKSGFWCFLDDSPAIFQHLADPCVVECQQLSDLRSSQVACTNAIRVNRIDEFVGPDFAAGERIYRKALIAISKPGHTIQQFTSDAGLITLVALVVYIASFAFSLGPVVWTVINEIFPRNIRGRGVSIATAANWGSAWLVSQFFLSLVDTIGESGTFMLFAALSVVAFIWILKVLPETRGR